MLSREELIAQAAAAELPDREAVRLDLSAPPEPRSPVWGKALERGALTLLTGRRGTGKTFLYTGLGAAIATGQAEYLGYPLNAQRTLVIDEENPRFVAQARLRALGVKDDDSLWYYNRNGIRVGDKRWNRWLDQTIEEFKPDLIVIDGLVAATNINDLNDQTKARDVYEGLKIRSEEHQCAVLVLHHEKKRQANNPYDRSEAAMGAISFINLADIHLATELPADEDELRLVKYETQEGPLRTLHTEPTLYWLRLRDDIEPEPETFVIESVKEGDTLVELEIRRGIAAPTKTERKVDVKRERLRALFAPGRFEVGKEYTASDFIKYLDSRDEWTKLVSQATKDGWLSKEGSGTHTRYRYEGEPVAPAV